jgi:hypothetical protein
MLYKTKQRSLLNFWWDCVKNTIKRDGFCKLDLNSTRKLNGLMG